MKNRSLRESSGALTAAILALALLAGCATGPQQPAADTPPLAAYRSDIQLGGRLSIQYEQDMRPQSVSGSFVWTQHDRQIEIDLLSPLGQTIAHISMSPGQARLTQSGSPPRIAADADRLTETTLGWPLPLNGMAQWLQGRGMALHNQPFAATSNASSEYTTADGWRIRYDNWESSPAPHPRRIDMQRQTSQAGLVSIRLVLDQWQPL